MTVLATLKARRELLDDQEAAVVDELRRQGISWHRIGIALGMTGEGARRKYASRIES